MKLNLKDNLVTVFVVLIVTFAYMMVYNHAKADLKTITLINNGKAGGSYNARTLMYKDGLEAKGYDIKYENIGKVSQAVKIFKDSTEPTIMVFSSNQVHKQNLYHDKENFLLVEYQQPMYICKINNASNKTKNLTVGHGKGYDTKLLYKILGNDIVLVPYKNSGAILKGILGGDVEAMINNQGKSLKYMKSGKGTCEVSTELPIMMATVIGKNIDVETMGEILMDVSNNKAFTDYREDRKLKRPNGSWSKQLEIVQDSETHWQ